MTIPADTSRPRDPSEQVKASWRPMIGLALAQVLMSFNVAALPVSLGGMVEDFGVPPTTVSTAIVTYGLVVAALVMVGAKLGQRVGWVLIFRIMVAVFAVAELMMVLSPSIGWVIAAQALAGAAAAIIVPALVALIAENYRDAQQATAIGSLGSARAFSGLSAFLIGGALGTLVGWRPVFAILIVVAVVVFLLSFTLRSDRGNDAISIDIVGAFIIGIAVMSLTLGFNNLNSWGLLTASPTAPFSVLGVSGAPVLIVLGIILGQAFFVWTRRRANSGRVPLISLEVVSESTERAAVYAMFVVVALEAALNFTVPLYIQIVQGRTPFDTSLAMMPFNITVFVTATLVVRFYGRFSPRVIARFSFALTTGALIWLSFVVTNNWETVPTILGLIVFGIGQGALVTLVFNVLVTAAPKELADPRHHHRLRRAGRRRRADQYRRPPRRPRDRAAHPGRAQRDRHGAGEPAPELPQGRDPRPLPPRGLDPPGNGVVPRSEDNAFTPQKAPSADRRPSGEKPLLSHAANTWTADNEGAPCRTPARSTSTASGSSRSAPTHSTSSTLRRKWPSPPSRWATRRTSTEPSRPHAQPSTVTRRRHAPTESSC